LPRDVIHLPARFAIDGKIRDNRIRQVERTPAEVEVQTRTVERIGVRYETVLGPLLVTERRVDPVGEAGSILRVRSLDATATRENARSDAFKPRWLKPSPLDPGEEGVDGLRAACEAVLASWVGEFRYNEEDQRTGARGLRSPQVGALHAVLAHWKARQDPCTVVLPTGTGKTETMLALLVNQRLPRLLVVVPNVALRDQVSGKFLTLGVLRDQDVIGPGALLPVVGVLEHRPESPAEVDDFFDRCNVVVTNMQVVGGCDDAVQDRIAERCSHLFIDEAHHISARTWDAFRRRMMNKLIVQFTATPFRTDGRSVDGRVVFNYPLRKAQEEGYFRPVTFKPVNVMDEGAADEHIALAAVVQMEEDRARGLAHLVMARVDTIERAEVVHAVYIGLVPEHRPLLVHNRMAAGQRKEALRALRSGETKIIVCVNMLGEGFDLPELKIAALHDVHKSLAVTIQFTGRFTRSAPHIGDATVVANIADPRVDERLRELYAEDADWNVLLRRLSEGGTARQQRRSELIESFVDAPPELPLQNLLPKMSAVVYRTTCERWTPENLDVETKHVKLRAEPALSRDFELLIFVTRETEPVTWGDVKEISNVTWHLYMLHWNRELGLLFINSSNNDGLHEEMAKSVAGADIDIVKGEDVFRCMADINRIVLLNMGLSQSLSWAVRHMRLVGPDIGEAFTPAELETKTKSDTFGKGFAKGDKVTFGCSVKGRVWSHRIAQDPSEWVDWCAEVGAKLADETVDTAEIFLRHVLIPVRVAERPALVPLVIEWSEHFYRRIEDAVIIQVDGTAVPFHEAALELLENEREGPIRFRVRTEEGSADFELSFAHGLVRYVPLDDVQVRIRSGRKDLSLPEWFDKEPPVVRFEDNTFMIHDRVFRVRRPTERTPYDRAAIEAWDWPQHVDITVESQKAEKRPHSVQRHVIERLLDPGNPLRYDFLLDDDDHHEAADVVGLKVLGERLVVHLYHCKFSGGREAGARLDDLYAVCGQAQKSVVWKVDTERLVRHLRLRSAARFARCSVDRFEHGDEAGLTALGNKARFLVPDVRIFIVQPGLSKRDASVGQLDLLAATQAYLRDTYAVPLTVIGSP
jgi:superfamily II DNA or RNA helicase